MPFHEDDLTPLWLKKERFLPAQHRPEVAARGGSREGSQRPALTLQCEGASQPPGGRAGCPVDGQVSIPSTLTRR